MKTLHRPSTFRIFLLALCTVIAACASATGPDGTDNVPSLGLRYMQIEYGLNGAGDFDTLAAVSTIVTTAIKSTQDPLDPTAIALTDSLVQGDTAVVAPYGINFYRFFPNGDLAVRHNGRLIEFLPPDTPFVRSSVTLRDTFVVLPFGTKRDYTYTLFDTTLVDSNSKRVQRTRYQVVDSILFQGPTVVLPPARLLLLNATPISAMLVKLHRAITSTATIGSTSKFNREVVEYEYYYNPDRGYMVHQTMYTAGEGGRGRIVAPIPLP